MHSNLLLLLLLLLPHPFQAMGVAKEHGAPEAGQLPTAWTTGRRKREYQRGIGAESVARQYRMR